MPVSGLGEGDLCDYKALTYYIFLELLLSSSGRSFSRSKLPSPDLKGSFLDLNIFQLFTLISKVTMVASGLQK